MGCRHCTSPSARHSRGAGAPLHLLSSIKKAPTWAGASVDNHSAASARRKYLAPALPLYLIRLECPKRRYQRHVTAATKLTATIAKP
jgi:hypothetical protein